MQEKSIEITLTKKHLSIILAFRPWIGPSIPTLLGHVTLCVSVYRFDFQGSVEYIGDLYPDEYRYEDTLGFSSEFKDLIDWDAVSNGHYAQFGNIYYLNPAGSWNFD